MPCLHRLYLRGWREGSSFALRLASLNYLLLGWARDAYAMLPARRRHRRRRSAARTLAAGAAVGEPAARAQPVSGCAGSGQMGAAVAPITPFAGWVDCGGCGGGKPASVCGAAKAP